MMRTLLLTAGWRKRKKPTKNISEMWLAILPRPRHHARRQDLRDQANVEQRADPVLRHLLPARATTFLRRATFGEFRKFSYGRE
jgi:hypothetical protein